MKDHPNNKREHHIYIDAFGYFFILCMFYFLAIIENFNLLTSILNFKPIPVKNFIAFMLYVVAFA